jgi:uncharacterized protein YbaP (TraB family)
MFLLSLFFSFTTQAQSSLLYEVAGNDLEQPSYLFGTIHLMCPENIYLSDTLREKLNSSEQLVLELDFDAPGMMQEMQQAMMRPTETPLRELLTEEEYAQLSQFFQDSLNIPEQMLAQFNPIALYGAVASKMLGCQPGSYEQALMEVAQEKQIEVEGLETVDEQLEALGSISEEEQAAYLYDALADYEASAQEFGEMLSSYMKQDAELLYELSHAAMAEFGDMEQHLLVDRNHAWVPIMETMMAEPTFFAVGAGHLGGEEGLLSLLEGAGYTVTAVMQ